MARFSPPKVESKEKEATFPGKDGGRLGFSKPQGPKPHEKREDGLPSERQRLMQEGFCSAEPPVYGAHHVAQKRERWPRRIQTAEPSAQRGGIRHAIRIFDRGSGSFPGVTFQEIPSQ